MNRAQKAERAGNATRLFALLALIGGVLILSCGLGTRGPIPVSSHYLIRLDYLPGGDGALGSMIAVYSNGRMVFRNSRNRWADVTINNAELGGLESILRGEEFFSAARSVRGNGYITGVSHREEIELNASTIPYYIGMRFEEIHASPSVLKSLLSRLSVLAKNRFEKIYDIPDFAP